MAQEEPEYLEGPIESPQEYQVHETHIDVARRRITYTLLWGLLGIIGLTLIRLLFWPDPLPEQVLDFIKWAIGVLGALFGTAMGFYFGGKTP